MNNIICIAGPTASGKTALAVELAKEFNGEVVSCDSMYVYKYMNIGTAKPSPEEQQGIPHHMIDVSEPWDDFSVSRYCEMAVPSLPVARAFIWILSSGAIHLRPVPLPAAGNVWKPRRTKWAWNICSSFFSP